MILYYIIIAIVVIDFIWTQYLSYRNRKKMSAAIPKQLDGIYNQEEYSKQQAYQKANSKFGLVTSFFSFILVLIVLVFQLFGWFDGIVREYISNPILISLAFLGCLYIVNDILTLPLGYYGTFVIEEKFGFNKSTKKMFWTDQLKSLLLTAILGGLILSILIWFFNDFQYAWLYAWAVVTLFSLFMNLFYSNLIVPLFNKQTPLQDGELRDAINTFSEKAGFKVSDIYLIDASKRSTKANAYFTGLGRKKRIVLYDTLVNDLSVEEVVAVLAHEIGHYKKKHTLFHLIESILYTGALLFILSFFINSQSLAEALGSDIPSFHLGIIAFSILFTPISVALGLLTNIMSRKNEYEADQFAADFGLSDALINGLKKLSTKSLSNLNPDSWTVFFYYSHPTLLQRIEKLNKIEK